MIEVDHISRYFGDRLVVDDVSLHVTKGEVLGFIGPNGSGKSTTMRMITGFIAPSAGTVRICGYDMNKDPVPAKRHTGYLPESAPLYGEMSVLDFLRFTARLRGLRGEGQTRALRRVVELCSLGSVLGQSIDTLSKGFQHRTCFAQALVSDPDVLVLDEPTDGLDPNQKHEMRTLIRRMGEEKAIILSTHILEEVDEACTRAVIIDGGRIVASGTPAEIKARSANAGSVLLGVAGISGSRASLLVESLPSVLKSEIVRERDGLVTMRVFPRQPWTSESARNPLAASLSQMASNEHLTIEELRTDEGRLDDVFRVLTVPSHDGRPNPSP